MDACETALNYSFRVRLLSLRLHCCIDEDYSRGELQLSLIVIPMRAAAAAAALAGRSTALPSTVFTGDKSDATHTTTGRRSSMKGDDDDNSDNDSIASSALDGGSDAGSSHSLNTGRLTDNGDYSVDGAPALDPNRKISPLHRDILQALTNSINLSPLNVDVLNESYWYRSRARLGPKKQNATVVNLNPKTGFYEAYMYKMKVSA